MNPEASKLPSSETQCFSRLISGEPDYSFFNYIVSQGDKNAFFAEVGKVCSQYTCPADQEQAIWADKEEPNPNTINLQDKGKYVIGKSFKSDFKKCCRNCGSSTLDSCDKLIEAVSPGGCASDCVPGYTDQTIEKAMDGASCTGGDRDKVKEAIAKTINPPKSGASGRTYCPFVMVATVLAALFVVS